MYKRDGDNIVADALSRRYEGVLECSKITVVTSAWIQEVINGYKGDSKAEEKIQSLLIQPDDSDLTYTYINGILKHNCIIYYVTGDNITSKLI